MARVVFWSPNAGMTGNTHVAVAVATLTGITHKSSCLLMHGNYNSKKMESSFTSFDDLKTSGAFENSNIGVSALIRLITSNKLTSDAIQNYAKPVLKDRLDVLYGMNIKDVDGYSQLVNNLPYLTRKAAEIYDLVFIDLPKGSKEKYIQDTLADAEIVVCVVNQDAVKMGEFFEEINSREELKNKPTLIVIGDYEGNAKFNVSNIRIKNAVKDPVYVIPHNYLFADACNSGNVIDFFYRNINADKRDYNGNFIAKTSEIVEKIIELAKIKD